MMNQREACFQPLYPHLPTQTINHFYPQSHHGDPSEGRHALADSREVVEERRGAVLLTERLHLLDRFGHRLQEGRQDCLNNKETTYVFTVKVFSHMVDFSKFNF